MFLEINGMSLPGPLDVDAAERMMIAAAKGELDVPEIADGLRGFTA